MKEKAAAKINPESMNASQVARLYRCSPQAVGLWAKRQGCPKNPDGRTFDLAAVIAWREETIRGEDDLPGATDYEKRELCIVKIEQEKIKLRRMQEELVPIDQVQSGLRRLSELIKGAGEALQKLYGPDAQEVVNEAIDAFERELE